MTPLASYRRLLSIAGPTYVLVAFVGRLPLAMGQLGTLLLVADRTGSYGLGGLSAGALAVANAVGAPSRARWPTGSGSVPSCSSSRCSAPPASRPSSPSSAAGSDRRAVVLERRRHRSRAAAGRARWPGCGGARSPARPGTTSAAWWTPRSPTRERPTRRRS